MSAIPPLSELEFVILSTLAGAVPASLPLFWAAVGEIYSEKSGVYNIGLEGVMLLGALAGIWSAVASGNIACSLLAAGAVGLAAGLLHAFFTVTLNANQIVTGFAVVILGTGLTAFLGMPYVGLQVPITVAYPLPFLSKIPVLGSIFFAQDVIVYLSYLLIPLSWAILYRSTWGIAIRASGDDPEAARLMGIHVAKTRYFCIASSGVLAAIGGAYLSVVHTQMWVERMTAGRGWIALALVIFSRWNPVGAAGGALLFGTMLSLQFRLQAIGIAISSHLLSTLPYLTTILVMVIAARPRYGFKGMPRSLGKTTSPCN